MIDVNGISIECRAISWPTVIVKFIYEFPDEVQGYECRSKISGERRNSNSGLSTQNLQLKPRYNFSQTVIWHSRHKFLKIHF